MFSKLLSYARGPFHGVPFDSAAYKADLAKTPVFKRYIVFFTPRSGSTRVTDVLQKTKCMDAPHERFNPDFIPKIAEKVNASNTEQLVEMLIRKRRRGGVFGAELTFQHLRKTFRDDAQFLGYFANAQFFWLIRQDIVGQAVSITRMVQTGQAHRMGRETPAKARFTYQPAEIRKRITQLRWLETATESFFDRHGITPLRTSYEQINAMEPMQVAHVFADPMGVSLESVEELKTVHRKMGDPRNVDFAERFRQENADLVAQLTEERQALIAALNPE